MAIRNLHLPKKTDSSDYSAIGFLKLFAFGRFFRGVSAEALEVCGGGEAAAAGMIRKKGTEGAFNPILTAVFWTSSRKWGQQLKIAFAF